MLSFLIVWRFQVCWANERSENETARDSCISETESPSVSVDLLGRGRACWPHKANPPWTGVRLWCLHGGGIFQGRIMRGESVGAPVQGWLLLRQDSEPEKQKTDDSMGGGCSRGRRGLVFLLFPVCVYPWGVSRGYGCHIVPDISCVVAQRGSSVVLSVKPNTRCVIQERIMQTWKLSSPGFVAPIGVPVKICIQVWEATWGI